MPRSLQFSLDRLAELALPVFWRAGYAATSIDDLIEATKASRHAIYRACGNKRSLLIRCIEEYRREIVDPAFCTVEKSDAQLAQIEAYFENQIAAAERQGLPGVGCMLANLATDTAPTDVEVADIVRTHYARLRAGFRGALAAETAGERLTELDGWAALLATTAQGLWSQSRVATDAAELRRPVAALLNLIKRALER